MNKISVTIFWAAFIIVGFFSIKNLFGSGYFPMHDDTQPTRVFLMKQALLDGQFPVRWVEHLGYGYGYPIFNFYAPLPYYLGALISFLGFDAIESTKFLFAIVTAGSFVTMFLLLRSFINLYGSIVGAAIYTLFPYHAVNTYVRGALSEQFGYFFVPLVILSYLKISQNVDRRINIFWIIILGVSGALVAVSHNLSAIIVVVSLLPIFLFHIFQNKKKKTFILNLILALFIALGLSAFYLIPVVFESHLTNVNSQVGGGADFKDHFVCASQLWSGAWGFGGSVPGCNDGMSFKLGKTNVVFFLTAVVFSIYLIFVSKNKKDNFFFYFGTALAVIGIFFATPISKFVWDIVPVLDYVQYPWRFLTIAGLGVSIVVGFAIFNLSKIYKSNLVPTVSIIIIIGLTLLNNAKLFQPQEYVKKNLYHYTSPDSIRYKISKISDEYMPKNFTRPKSTETVPSEYIMENESLEILHVSSSSKKIEANIDLETEQNVLLNLAPYPSWKIFIDDKEVMVRATNTGMIISAGAGEHTLTALFKQTTWQFIGNALTIVTIFGLGAAIMRQLYGKKTS